MNLSFSSDFVFQSHLLFWWSNYTPNLSNVYILFSLFFTWKSKPLLSVTPRTWQRTPNIFIFKLSPPTQPIIVACRMISTDINHIGHSIEQNSKKSFCVFFFFLTGINPELLTTDNKDLYHLAPAYLFN